jgi:hypothetical protein
VGNTALTRAQPLPHAFARLSTLPAAVVIRVAPTAAHGRGLQMAVRVFSDEDLERLRSFPEINREELIRFFTLTPAGC